MAWGGKPEIRGLGLIALLAACTAPNPAYEGGGLQGPTEPLGSSSAEDPDVGAEDPDGPSETTAAPSTTSSTQGTTETGETGPTDETSTSGDSTDTGLEEPPPPQVGPFNPPVPIGVLNDPLHQDDDPTLTDDMLELFFASSRGPAGDIFVSHREQASDPWGPPEPANGLNSLWIENTPEISPDGLTIYFSSNRNDLPDEDVFFATRSDRISGWSVPVRVAELSTPGLRDVCPFPTANGLHLYVCVGPEILPELDLVRFDREGLRAPWSEPSPLVELNTAGLECAAWLDPSERVLAFMSDRPGGTGAIDLWLTSRTMADEPFEGPAPLVELNSPAVDEDPWVSPDGATVYFASERLGTLDIFMALRAE
jgi:hypothetical protein